MAFKIGEAFVQVGAEAGSLAGDMDGIGRKITGMVAGLGIGAMVGKAISDGMNLDVGRANLQNQFGLTAADAERYGAMAGEVYSGNFGESMEEVNSVIGTVGQAMGGLGAVSDDEIQRMTGNVLTLADTFSLDAAQSIKALEGAVSNGLAPSFEHASDVATRVFQNGGPGAQEFLEIIGEYAPNLQNAGLSMEQFGAMSVAYLDAGGYSVDQFADSIREMTIRVADGSAESAGAFDTLGLDAAEMTAKMAEGGPVAQEAFQQIVAGLNGITDPVAQQAAGAQLFGSMWEDSSGAILAGLQPVPGALGEVSGATQNLSDVAGETATSKIDGMKRTFEGWAASMVDLPGGLGLVAAGVMGLGPEMITAGAAVATLVMNLTGQAGAQVLATASMVASKVALVASTVATGAATAAQWLFNAALSANPIALVVIAITALVAGLVWFFTQTELGQKIIEAVWGAIKTAIGATVGWITDTAVPAVVGAWDWVVTKVRELGSIIASVWGAITGAISSAVSAVRSVVMSVIGAVVGFLAGAWNGALNLVRSVWSGITGSVSGAIGTVLGVVRGLPGQIMGAFSGAGRWLVSAGGDLIRGLWNGISNITGWLMSKISGFVGGVTSKIKGLFGIGSPSKLFADEIGQWLPPGIAVGMEDNLGVVQDAAQEMAKAAMPEIAGPTIGPVGFSGQGSGPGGVLAATGALGGIRSATAPTPAVSQPVYHVAQLTVQVAGNLDPTNPTAWRYALESIRDGIRTVERSER